MILMGMRWQADREIQRAETPFPVNLNVMATV